jgi:hypothetical protein
MTFNPHCTSSVTRVSMASYCGGDEERPRFFLLANALKSSTNPSFDPSDDFTKLNAPSGPNVPGDGLHSDYYTTH